MAAGFNPAGVDGKPPIVPGASPFIAVAAVLTREPALARRAEEYTLAGVPGRGARDFGAEAADIVWEMTLEAVSWSSLQAFEALFGQYAAGQRYRLVSELDESVYWDHVEFRRYEPLELHALPGSAAPPHVLRVARVTWRWMQPQ